MMEKPVSFENNSETLFGVLYSPEPSCQTRTGIIFLHGWGTYRIGPHRMLIEAARCFCNAGYFCLSFDFRGRGESQGSRDKITLVDMIDDTRKAVNFLKSSAGVENIILLGLCSGGEVAVGSALCDSSITGLALWSTPMLARQVSLDKGVKKSAHELKNYWHKLFLKDTWKKLVGFRLNTGRIFKTIFQHISVKPPEPAREAVLLEMFRSFDGKVLFAYGSNDPEAEEACRAYESFNRENNIEAEFHWVEGANHNFYSSKWKEELLGLTRNWLDTLQ